MFEFDASNTYVCLARRRGLEQPDPKSVACVRRGRHYIFLFHSLAHLSLFILLGVLRFSFIYSRVLELAARVVCSLRSEKVSLISFAFNWCERRANLINHGNWRREKYAGQKFQVNFSKTSFSVPKVWFSNDSTSDGNRFDASMGTSSSSAL